MSRKQSDGVEAMLRKADRTLEDWFEQSRMTTQQASVVFVRFLGRARREGAGALRQRVDDLQKGLGKLSAGLQHIEHERKRKSHASPGRARKPAARASRKPTRTARKKAA